MKRSLILIFLAGLINFNKVSAQKATYDNVDSIMRQYNERIKFADELYKVIYFIRNTFDADSLRLRASFIWITENISYDVEGFKKEDPRASMLNYVIKNKKAVCGGYAGLLKFFCDAFNIESEIVHGIARTGKRDINVSQYKLRSNHAWNAVKVNGCWRLIDATWATGSVDDIDVDNPKFYKDYKEIYYLVPPERLVFNHMPDQNRYQYLTISVSKEKFSRWPLFTTEFLKDSIREIYPDTSLIKTKVGDTIVFKMNRNFVPQKVYIQSPDVEKANYSGEARRNGEWIEFKYPVRISGNYIVYLGYETFLSLPALVGYKLEVINRSR